MNLVSYFPKSLMLVDASTTPFPTKSLIESGKECDYLIPHMDFWRSLMLPAPMLNFWLRSFLFIPIGRLWDGSMSSPWYNLLEDVSRGRALLRLSSRRCNIPSSVFEFCYRAILYTQFNSSLAPCTLRFICSTWRLDKASSCMEVEHEDWLK